VTTTFEQFLAALLNGAERERIGLTLTDEEARLVAAHPVTAKAYYEAWARPRGEAQAAAPLGMPPPAGPRINLPPPPPAGLPVNLPPPAPFYPRQQPVRFAADAPPGWAQPSFLERHPMFLPAYVAAGIALLALFPWPYGYYVFLRWALTITAALLTVHAVRSRQQAWLFLSIPMMILLAPAVFIVLDREIWAFLDFAAAVGLCLAGSSIRAPGGPRPDAKPRWEWWQIALLVYGIGLALALISIPVGGGSSGLPCEMQYGRSGTFCL